MRFEIPVTPDPDDARDLLREELGNPEGAPPTVPQWILDFLDWLRSLFDGAGSGASTPVGQTVALVVLVVLIVGLLVVAFVVFGVPRLRRRSTVTGDLFGEDDARSAAELRGVAEEAARAGDYTTAVVEAFRSLARDLAERGVVVAFPGTTARGFAVRAAEVLPDLTDRLAAGATDFDSLRYLGGVGTLEQWERMSALDADVRAAAPALRSRAARALARDGES